MYLLMTGCFFVSFLEEHSSFLPIFILLCGIFVQFPFSRPRDYDRNRSLTAMANKHEEKTTSFRNKTPVTSLRKEVTCFGSHFDHRSSYGESHLPWAMNQQGLGNILLSSRTAHVERISFSHPKASQKC